MIESLHRFDVELGYAEFIYLRIRPELEGNGKMRRNIAHIESVHRCHAPY